MKVHSEEIYSKSTQETSQNSIIGRKNYRLKYSINWTTDYITSYVNPYIKLHNSANMF